MRGNARVLADLLRVRTQVENFIDRLVRTLDRIDADTEELEEFEEDDDILEPSLGATEDFDQRRSWRRVDLHSPDLEADGPCCEYCPIT